MNYKLYIFALMCFSILFLQGQEADLKFSLVELQVQNDAEISEILSQGFDVTWITGKKGTVGIVAQQHELTRLSQLGYIYKVVHEDFTAYQQKRLKTPEVKSLQIGQGSLGGYFNNDEVNAFLDSIHSLYPHLMSAPASIGKTIEGRDIFAYKITSNPESENNKPRSFINGLQHAREPMSIIAPLYFTQWLLENYGTDELATYIVDHRETWFVPLVNVDGYIYNEQVAPNGGGMWRKNMRDNNENGIFETWFDGVDLNRNFGYGWGYDNTGSQPYPGSIIYRGTGPFSEPETEALRRLCVDKNFKTALNFHTSGNLFIYPNEPDGSAFPHQEVFREYGHDVTKDNGYIFGNGLETVNYISNGNASSWMYGEQEEKELIMAFTPEIGNRFDFFWAPTERIIPLAEQNLYIQQYIAMVAGAYLKAEDYRFDDFEHGNANLAAEAGETIDLIVSVRNKGWSMDAQSVTATLSVDDEFVTINSNTYTRDFAALTTEEISFSISLSEEMPSGHVAEISMHFSCPQGYNLTETIDVTFGNPLLIFFDNALMGMQNWQSIGTWGITDERGYNGPYSFNDSPHDIYDPNTLTTMTMAVPIDLSGLNHAVLTFMTRYDMEKDFDLAQLQISTDNGNTWSPLGGGYSTEGAGHSGVQPLGEPVYNGFRDIMWVKEKVSLDSFLAEEILIRFLIASNSSNEKAGWYLDDIRIIGYADESILPEIQFLTRLPNTPLTGPYPLEAKVSSNHETPQVRLFFSNDSNTFHSEQMQQTTHFRYTAAIPEMEMGDTVYYYVEVTDDQDNTVTSETKSFLVTNSPPAIYTGIQELYTELAVGETIDHILAVSNDGLLPLEWSMQWKPDKVISDPAGDAVGQSPDIIALYADLLKDNSLFLQIDFANEIDPETMVAYFLADTDMKSETGWQGEEIFGYPHWDLGFDYMLVWDLANIYGQGSTAFLLSANTNSPYALTEIHVEGKSMWLTIPLMRFGNDDGNMNVAVFCGNDYGYDAAPDEGFGTIRRPSIASWLFFDKKKGTLHQNETTDVNISLNSVGIPPGVYETTLQVESNDPGLPVLEIPATMRVLNNKAEILSFGVEEQIADAMIVAGSHAITIFADQNADLSGMVAEFTLSEGATAYVGATEQQSGQTVNDFSEPVTYTIVAEDHLVVKEWTVTVEVVAGISQQYHESIEFYPNPAADRLFFRGKGNFMITIYDVNGKMMYHKPSHNLEQSLDISTLPKGLFVISFSDSFSRISKPLHIIK